MTAEKHTLATGPNYAILRIGRILVLEVASRPDQSLAQGADNAEDMFGLFPTLVRSHLDELDAVAWDLTAAPVPGPRTRWAMRACLEQLATFPKLRMAVFAQHATTKMFFRRVLLAKWPERTALAEERTAGLAWCSGVEANVELAPSL